MKSTEHFYILEYKSIAVAIDYVYCNEMLSNTLQAESQVVDCYIIQSSKLTYSMSAVVYMIYNAIQPQNILEYLSLMLSKLCNIDSNWLTIFETSPFSKTFQILENSPINFLNFPKPVQTPTKHVFCIKVQPVLF